ncbi:MAG TPA: hypothetical protein VKU38_21180 [Ktedonobacteraceae bacterium]|nr:hypothetical protein [Ktedonobacteraceae bacterium]
MAISSDVMTGMHTNYYYYRNHGPVSHSRPRPRQSRPESSHEPESSETEPDQQSHQQRRWFMKLVLAILFILLLIGGLAWGILWKPINDILQNDAVIGNQLMIQVQVQQPANVTEPATIKFTYTDANGKIFSSTYPLSGNTVVIKGEVLHLLWSPARFRLTGVVVAPKNINTLLSMESDFNDSDLNTPGSGLILTVTHCAVVIGPINDTHLHTLTIIVVPDGTSTNSCMLSNG